MNLKVIEISVRNNKGHVVLADQAHQPATSHVISLEFPVTEEPCGDFASREAQIVRDAKAMLRAAHAALDAR